MAERSDEAFIIVREFMTRGLGLTGLPLLVYARIYGFCESGSPYFESKAAKSFPKGGRRRSTA